jgi:hypothetical protein
VVVVLVRMLVGRSGWGIFAGSARGDSSAASKVCGGRSTGGGAEGEHRGGPGSGYIEERPVVEVDDMQCLRKRATVEHNSKLLHEKLTRKP